MWTLQAENKALPSIYSDNDKESGNLNVNQKKNNTTDKVKPQLTINTIKIINNHLLISGIGTVSVKDPVVLQNPSRIVFDIPHSGVASKDLIKTLVLNNKDIVKIGQFDADTVRVVINTPTPDNYSTIISSDLQSLVIASKDKINISELPDSNNIAQIKNIKVENQDENTTLITLIFNSPVIHDVKRSKNKISFEFHNVNSPAKAMISALATTNQFHG